MLVNLQAVRSAKRHLVTFTKAELNAVLSIYSYQVAKGNWRDYAVDFTPALAVFSMTRSTHEQPIASVVKQPANTATGFVFEVFFEKKRISRAADLNKALDVLREALAN